MPASNRPQSYPAVIAAVLALGALTGCQTSRVESRENALAAAGFVIKPANTPERISMLHRLPPHHFVQRPHGNRVDFVYADPMVCNCLYVGSQAAYNRFREHQREEQLVSEQQMTAQMYSDAAWNWQAWGPWGGDWDFEPGLGW